MEQKGERMRENDVVVITVTGNESLVKRHELNDIVKQANKKGALGKTQVRFKYLPGTAWDPFTDESVVLIEIRARTTPVANTLRDAFMKGKFNVCLEAIPPGHVEKEKKKQE